MSLPHSSVMTLFSAPRSVYSHRARMVLAEKAIEASIEHVDPDDPPEDLVTLNPYNTLPTLVDRDLVLYESRVIIEYLDERFPHPPMMPVDPVSRAQTRLALYRVEADWYSLIPDLEADDVTRQAPARRALRDRLIAAAEVFAARAYFLSEEFTMVDASIAPLLWRLPAWGVDLPDEAAPVDTYAGRMFAREGFRRSLSPEEAELR